MLTALITKKLAIPQVSYLGKVLSLRRNYAFPSDFLEILKRFQVDVDLSCCELRILPQSN